MGDLSHFERELTVGAHLAEESVTKTAKLLGASKSNSFYDYVGIHKSQEDNISEGGQWAKFNTERNRLSYNEKN
jgi:hypothetical protein